MNEILYALLTVVLLIVFLVGSNTAKNSIASDCDLIGAFSVAGKVYNCVEKK